MRLDNQLQYITFNLKLWFLYYFLKIAQIQDLESIMLDELTLKAVEYYSKTENSFCNACVVVLHDRCFDT